MRERQSVNNIDKRMLYGDVASLSNKYFRQRVNITLWVRERQSVNNIDKQMLYVDVASLSNEYFRQSEGRKEKTSKIKGGLRLTHKS